MTPPSEPLDIAWCEARLQTQLIGRKLLYYPQLISTMDEAFRLAQAGEAEGTVVVAGSQSAGRGRRGQRWYDRPGQCLLLSVLLRPTTEPQLLPILSLGAAAAVAELLSSYYELPVATKWPNDLLLSSRKVGGLLLESHGQVVVIGLGLNVNGQPDSFQAHVDRPLTTLEAEHGAPLSREEVLVGIIANIDDIYRQFRDSGSEAILGRYRRFESLLGQTICFTVGGEQDRGTAEAITDRGALLVATSTGHREITAGEVELSADSD